MAHSCYLVDASPTDESPSFLFVGLSEALPDGKSGKYFFNLFWRDEEATSKDFWTYSASREELYETALEKTKHLPPKLRSIVEYNNHGWNPYWHVTNTTSTERLDPKG